jgi:hypothetical protein
MRGVSPQSYEAFSLEEAPTFGRGFFTLAVAIPLVGLYIGFQKAHFLRAAFVSLKRRFFRWTLIKFW